MSLKMRLYPDPVLRHQAEPINEITDEIRQLADGMVETLVIETGYGLAAPQVGVSKRLILVDVEDDFYIVVNPEIVEFSEEIQDGPEGCLSIPGIEADLERSERILVRGLSLEGEALEIEAEGLIARVFQHELDHLNGILFIDHLSNTKRNLLLKEFEKMQKEKKSKKEREAKEAVL
jgi:peptide deformylase